MLQHSQKSVQLEFYAGLDSQINNIIIKDFSRYVFISHCFKLSLPICFGPNI